MFGSRYIPQQMVAFLTLYEKLEASNDLNNEGILKIAFFVRVLKKHDKYRNTFQPIKYAINEMIRRMPLCARNLYFAPELCIWNKGRDEYLWATKSQQNPLRQNIFTYRAENLQSDGLWKAQFYEETYFINKKHEKEYLRASPGKYDSLRRHVSTRFDDGFISDMSAWKIELNGNYCYIKNLNFDEYLSTSNKNDTGYVFTTIELPNPKDNAYYLWQLRDCS